MILYYRTPAFGKTGKIIYDNMILYYPTPAFGKTGKIISDWYVNMIPQNNYKQQFSCSSMIIPQIVVPFMKPEFSLPCSQQPVTSPYLERDQRIPPLHHTSWKYIFSIILASTPTSCNLPLCLRFSLPNPLLSSPFYLPRPSHIHLHLVTLIILRCVIPLCVQRLMLR